jgi:hypothetical protein
MNIVERIPIVGAMLTSTNVDGTGDPIAYNASTTYGLDDDDTTVQVTDPTSHLIYRSRQDANTGNTPATSPSWWQVVGYTNAWRMFDERVGSQTTRAATIVAEVLPGASADAGVFLNMDADTVRLQVTDPDAGAVFDETKQLFDPTVDNHWDYCFAPIPVLTNCTFTGMPPFPGATVKTTITKTSGTAACGVFILGFSSGLAEAEWGPTEGIDDYSTKNRDPYGTAAIVEGDYSANMNLVLYVDPANSPSLKQQLTRLRATPAVYIADSTLPDMVVYGWPESWQRAVSYPTYDVYTARFVGLT